MNTVPLVDLSVQHAQIAEEVDAGFAEVLAAGDFIGGKAVAAFEQEYAEFAGARHCVGVANGTDALEMALRAQRVGSGDEVVVPANTFIATAEAVVRAGARPVFVDVDDEALLIDPSSRRGRRSPSGPAPSSPSTSTVRSRPSSSSRRRWPSAASSSRGRRPVAGRDPARATCRHASAASPRRASTPARTSAPTATPARSSPTTTNWPRHVRAAGCARKPGEVPARRSSGSTPGWTPCRPWCCGRSCAGCTRWNAAAPRRGAPLRRRCSRTFPASPPARDAARQRARLAPLRRAGGRPRRGARQRVHAGARRRHPLPGAGPPHTAPWRGFGPGPGACPVAERAAGEILSLPLFPGITAEPAGARGRRPAPPCAGSLTWTGPGRDAASRGRERARAARRTSSSARVPRPGSSGWPPRSGSCGSAASLTLVDAHPPGVARRTSASSQPP